MRGVVIKGEPHHNTVQQISKTYENSNLVVVVVFVVVVIVVVVVAVTSVDAASPVNENGRAS